MTNTKRAKLSNVATVKPSKKSPAKSPTDACICELTPPEAWTSPLSGQARQTAFKLIRKATDSCIIIDTGLWKTTCATVIDLG